ncbi:MAG: glucose-inhibited division protein A [Phormidesmis sp. CAN_BIN36]|nr:glucose-inhibited division protein A [Phormidesmis sp. CAN_BIN36]
MDRSKFVAYLTGAIALMLGIGYLILVQFLDMRGEMIPAPIVELVPIVDRLFDGFHFQGFWFPLR